MYYRFFFKVSLFDFILLFTIFDSIILCHYILYLSFVS